MKKHVRARSTSFVSLFQLGTALFALPAASILAGCSKGVSIDSPQGPGSPTGGDATPPGGRNPAPDGSAPTSPACAPEDRLTWRFVQPQPTVNRSVDLLFVTDTSRSLDAERGRIASTLPTFASQLPPQTDYRIGVMLAHGGGSYYSGRLYSPSGVPKVLDSGTRAPSTIQSELTRTLSNPPQDMDSANGEAGMYSLLRGLRADRVAEMRAQGFLREGAALSVIFVTDENDICFRPELNGLTQFPDYAPAVSGNSEVTAYHRYCVGTDGQPAVTPARVLDGLRDLKSAQNLALGGIIHKNPASVPSGSGLEDAIGHGILQLVGSTLNGVTMELADASYATGLTELGSAVSTQLRLQVAFGLDGQSAVRVGTVAVRVDDRAVSSEFDPARREARIRAQDAGAAGSIVEVSACRG